MNVYMSVGEDSINHMNLIITNKYMAYTDARLLGYQGETNARTIKVVQPHIDEATAYRLIFDCGNNVIYEVDVTDGEYIVDGGLLLNIGTVKCQWQAVKLVGDTYELVAKSNIIEFEVKPSIQGDVAPIPTYEQAKSIIDNFAVQIAEKLDNVAINTDGNLEVTKNEKTDTYVIPGRITDMSFAPAESKLTLWKTVESGNNYMTTIISSVKTSNEEGNALVRKSDGMYVPKDQVVVDPPQTKKMTASTDVFWDYIYSDSQGFLGEATVEFIGLQIRLSKKHLDSGGYYTAAYSIPDDYYRTYKYFAIKFSGAEGYGTCVAITHDQAISDNILSEYGSKTPSFGEIGSSGVKVVVLPLENIRSTNPGLIGTHIHFGGLYTGNNTPYITVKDMMWTSSDDDLASF